MCPHNKTDAVSPDSNAVTGKISLPDELRQQIDYRVMVKLAEKDVIRFQYQRGFWDCLYMVFFVAWAVYLYWYYVKAEK